MITQLKSFNEAYLAATAANDTARNSDAGNDENNSNPKVEIFIGKIIFSLLVSIFFTFANRGGQQKCQNQSGSGNPHYLNQVLLPCYLDDSVEDVEVSKKLAYG